MAVTGRHTDILYRYK